MTIEKKFISQNLKELQITEYILESLGKVGVSHVKLQRTPLGEKILVSCSRPGLVVGRAGNVNISATGTPAATISLAGTLPTGVTFTAASGTGVISGTPAAGTAGSYSLTITSVIAWMRSPAPAANIQSNP